MTKQIFFGIIFTVRFEMFGVSVLAIDESGVYDNHNFASDNDYLFSEDSLSNGKVVMVTSFKGGVG